MILLKKLILKNIWPWRELNLDLENKGLCLINGKNGSGKSSIRLALELLLVGSVSEKLSVSELSYNEQGDTSATLLLTKDGNTIEITKYINHKKFGSKLIFKVNKVDKSTTDSRETRKIINSILGIDNNILMSNTIFSKFSPSFPESTDTERKNLLYSILPIDVYKLRYKKAKSEIENIDKDIQYLYHDIDIFKSRMSDTKDNVDINTEKAEKFTVEKAKKISQLLLKKEEKDKELKKLSVKDIESKIQYIESFEKPVLDVDKYKTVSKLVTELIVEKNKLETQVIHVEVEIDTIKETTCPLLDIECSKLKEKNSVVISKKKKELYKYQMQYEAVLDELSEAKIDLEKYQKNVEELNIVEERIKKLKQNIEFIKREKEYIQSAIDELEERIKEESKRINVYKEVIEDLKIKIKEYKTKVKAISLEISKLKELEPYYKFWETGFGKAGIPNMKIEGFLAGLEEETNKILSNITSNIYIKIKSQSTSKNKQVKEKISYEIIKKGKNRSFFSY